MKRKLTNILVTGGAGFIGSNFIRLILSRPGFSGRIINIDKLTYAGNLENLADIAEKFGDNRYFFEKADICDSENIQKIFEKYNIDTVVHFAAESHVDRSIHGPSEFIKTNIFGTFNLLDVAKNYWNDRDDVLFHHISTDEVYGSLGELGYFKENTAYDPRSPYSASKASSDHLVMAYFHTYGLPVTISNCSNNYGPYQFPEKLIPLMILNMTTGKELPVYGDGKNIRDWIYVDDHNLGVLEIIKNGKIGETYNIGGENEWENIKLVTFLCDVVAKCKEKPSSCYKQLITFVKDRLGHDRRYAIDCSKIRSELGWKQKFSFEGGLENTVRWYLSNDRWVKNVISGEYKTWMEKNYNTR